MKKVNIIKWKLKSMENCEGIDPTETKLLERGIFITEILKISSSCNIQLLSSKYLESNVPITFGEAASAIDRALEVAYSTMNECEIAEITIEMPGKCVHKSLENETVFLMCQCCVKIISNGKRVYEYSPTEVLDIGSIYKNLSSKLISEGCLCDDYPVQLSAFYILERALQWISLIHPKELEEESFETLILLKRQCYNNMALLQLNFGNFVAVESAASFVLSTDKFNVKALYRRAIANINLQNYGLAKSDLQIILTLEPTNKAAKSQIEILKKKSNQLDEHYALAMRKFLNLT